MLKEWNHLYLARVTVEATTPISIQSGQAELNYDTALTRDANGLPALPATAIAGVLRHQFQRSHGEAACNELFGYAEHRPEEGRHDESGQLSRLQVGWGAVHDSHNKPVQGLHLLAEAVTERDPILDYLLQSQPLKRERVRLNDRGCAADEGKYDLTAVPAGCRFSFELKLWSSTGDDSEWLRLLAQLDSPDFRLGSNTRSGFGAFRVLGAKVGHWDMCQPEQVREWRKISASLTSTLGLVESKENALANGAITAQISLQAEDFIRIGGGDKPFLPEDAEGRQADLLPQSESIIEWTDDRGGIGQRRALLPGSAIKGALAHRVLFHSNRIRKQYADKLEDNAFALAKQRDEVGKELFGYAREESDDGATGKVLLDDCYLPETDVQILWHNRVDRFTGGVIDGGLFSEEALFRPRFNVTLTILQAGEISSLARSALAATLDDLSNGLLPVGAGGSRGVGVCLGSVCWSDDGQWVEGGEH